MHRVPKIWRRILGALEVVSEVDDLRALLPAYSDDRAVVRAGEAEERCHTVGAGEVGEEHVRTLELLAGHARLEDCRQRDEERLDPLFCEELDHGLKICAVPHRNKMIERRRGPRVFNSGPKHQRPKIHEQQLLVRPNQIAAVEQLGQPGVLVHPCGVGRICLHQVVPADIDDDEIRLISKQLVAYTSERKGRVVALDTGVDDLEPSRSGVLVELSLELERVSDLPETGGERTRIAERDDPIYPWSGSVPELRTDEPLGIDVKLLPTGIGVSDVRPELESPRARVVLLVGGSEVERPNPDDCFGRPQQADHEDG